MTAPALTDPWLDHDAAGDLEPWPEPVAREELPLPKTAHAHGDGADCATCQGRP